MWRGRCDLQPPCLRVTYADEDFAVLRAVGADWMVHADHTYRDNPVIGLVEGVTGRGAGIELSSMASIPMQRKRLPDTAAIRCSPVPWTSRMACASALSSTMTAIVGCPVRQVQKTVEYQHFALDRISISANMEGWIPTLLPLLSALGQTTHHICGSSRRIPAARISAASRPAILAGRPASRRPPCPFISRR